MTFDERYDAKVDRSGGPDACWPWVASTTLKGYGKIGRGGFGMGWEFAHRVALERKLGRPIKPGYCSLHTCDNPPCNNPAHLFEGTKGDNNRDTAAKGRMQRGERHYLAKLTEDDVREIRRRATAGEKQKTLAEDFGVVQTGISKIVKLLTWKHVV